MNETQDLYEIIEAAVKVADLARALSFEDRESYYGQSLISANLDSALSEFDELRRKANL